MKGAVGGAEVDDKVNMAIDFNIVKKLYAYLPGGSNGLSLQEKLLCLSLTVTVVRRRAVSL